MRIPVQWPDQHFDLIVFSEVLYFLSADDIASCAQRVLATVNKETEGGKRSGSGRGNAVNTAPSRKAGKLGGKAAASRPAAATRKRKAVGL